MHFLKMNRKKISSYILVFSCILILTLLMSTFINSISIQKLIFFSQDGNTHIFSPFPITSYLLSVDVGSSLFFFFFSYFRHPLSSAGWRRRFFLFFFLGAIIVPSAMFLFSLLKKDNMFGGY
jgi:hypothetical protein